MLRQTMWNEKNFCKANFKTFNYQQKDWKKICTGIIEHKSNFLEQVITPDDNWIFECIQEYNPITKGKVRNGTQQICLG